MRDAMYSAIQKATIKEVAKQAGVSVSTVSHVINKTRYVEDDTAEKVLVAIKTLDYKPNILARSLKGKGTKTIGIVISDIRDSFFTDAVKSIESGANEQGFNVILCDAEGSVQRENSYIDILMCKGIDGLVFAPVDSEGEYADLVRSRLPVVQIDRMVRGLPFDFVGIDNLRCALEAVLHLIDHGFKKVGFIGYEKRYYTMDMRMRGYEEAILEKGLERRSLITSRSHGGTLIKDEIRKWLSAEKVDAVLCGNDDICFETLRAIDEIGLRIPDDVGVVTFDDVKWLQLLKSPVTAVRQPSAKIGASSLDLLIERIRNRTVQKARTLLLETRFLVRSSCGGH
jgi:LacI family transcriptional regulator